MRLEDFKPVTLAEKSEFWEFYRKYPPSHSEYPFTTLVSWSHYTPAHYAIMDGSLVMMHVMDGKPQFRPPIGEYTDDTVREIVALAKGSGGPRPIAAILEPDRARFERLFPGTAVCPDRDFYDYVYLTRELAGLSGKHHVSHRRRLNKFTKSYDYSVVELSPKWEKDVEDFIERWCRQYGCEDDPLLAAEVGAMKYCLEHFRDLELSGLALRIDGGIQAISLFERMNGCTWAIHFEKAMTDYEGIYQAISNEAAKALTGVCEYLNRESDLGIAGLRIAKERLHPDHMVKIYYLSNETLPC
ncbi:MAG: phosphatidylglycerol lysyltransferase domain-containing protein [Candidatus Altiarchaeota archaeon]